MNTVIKRPFRFGLVTAHVQSRIDWINKVRKVEDLGYSSLLVVDHVTTGLGPVVALTVAAEATKAIKVGSFVFCNDFRHPAILAKEIATLDLLSNGRFEFGLGAGYLPTDYYQSGIPFESASTRIHRFEEAIHVYKKIFTEELINFHGDYYTISNLKGLPKPAQKPHPSFYIGGGGKRVLSIAAREANIVGIAQKNSPKGLDLSSTTEEATSEKIAWVRDAAGERFDQLELSVMVYDVAITENRKQVAQQVGPHFGLAGEQALHSMQLLIGTVQQIVDSLYERRELYGISYIVINEKHLDTFAPVIARLAGK